MMKLDQYEPLGNDIILEIRETNKSPKGLILPSPQRDRIMRVMKTGSLVQEPIVPGSWVLVGPAATGIEIPFIDNNGNKVFCMQASVHGIIGTYDKDEKNEDKVFMVGEETASHEEAPGPSNIIDNPGIEHAPFLKETIGEA